MAVKAEKATFMKPGNEEQFLFEISGTKIRVTDFHATERLSAPFQIQLNLASEEEIAFDDVVGKTADLKIIGNENDRFFHGIIAGFSYTGSKGRFFRYNAVMMPSLWLLNFIEDCRIFQAKNIPGIVQLVLEEAGIVSDFAFRLGKSYEDREYCVQYRESNLDFISRLLEEEGIFYFFEHTQDKHTIVFGDGTVNYQPVPGESEIEFHAGDLQVALNEFVNKFTLSQQIRSGKVTLNDYNFKHPSLNLTCEKEFDTFKKLERYEYPGRYNDEGKGKKRAEAFLQESMAFHSVGRGESNVSQFNPGFTFTLTDHVREDLNQEYLLAEVNHLGVQPQVLEEEADFSLTFSYSNKFQCIPSSVVFKPERKTPRSVVEGVQTAIVVGPSGEEIYTDEHGRVKVQFHWDRLGRNDEKSSCWIRVSQAWAGASWGAMFIPRIGHEVIVEFEEGDPDRPIITGSVYHGSNVPPYPLPAEKTKSTIKSDSSSGGGGSNEFRFEDKKGSEEIFLHAQKDLLITVENCKNQAVGADETLNVGSNRTKSVGEDESEFIGSNKNVSIGSDEIVGIGSNQTVGIGSNKTEGIGSNMSLSVGGNATTGIGKNKSESIGKSYSLSVGDNASISVGKNSSVSIGKNSDKTVGDNDSISIGKNFNSKIGEKATVSVGKDGQLQIDGNFAVACKKKTVIDVKDQLTFKCGKASIVLKKNGDIQIKGNKFNFKASGDIKMKGTKISQN